MSHESSPAAFHETLRAMPSWLGALLVVASVAGALAALASSREHHSDFAFWLAALPGLAAAVLAPLAIATWRIETEVRPGTLVVRLVPFTKREIPLADIESCEPRVYRPIRDYLGWGWRIGPAGRALTVPGRHGVQLILRGGERLLISSEQSEKLSAAIRSGQPPA